MKRQRYNGWANYETWNVALWLGNDESFYRAMREMVKASKKPVNCGRAREIVNELLPDGTPDTKAMSRVRWGEIAAFLEENR